MVIEMQKNKKDEQVIIQHLPKWVRILREIEEEIRLEMEGSTYATTTVVVH